MPNKLPNHKLLRQQDEADDTPVVTPCGRPFCISRTSSHNSAEHGPCVDHHSSSEELERIYQCLNEAINEPPMNMFSAVFYEVLQALVTLWMCIFTFLYTYAWRQHKKKFLISVLVIIPAVVIVGCVVSGLLTTLVILGKIYSGLTNLKEKALRRDSALSMSPVRPENILRRPLCRRHSSAQASSSHNNNQMATRKSSQVSRPTYSGGCDQHNTDQ